MYIGRELLGTAALGQVVFQNTPIQPPPDATVFDTSDIHPCGGCGKAGRGMRKCGRCKRVHYCSKECQTEDWRGGHREKCDRFIELMQEARGQET